MVDTVRIFLSSPGDVADERGLARQVLQGLASERAFSGKVLIEAVSWDDPGNPAALDAGLTPQEAINRARPKPSECDVVAVILWSRLGTPLPDEYRKADQSLYRSGTEWEFLDAIQHAGLHGRPTVWVYRRSERKAVYLDDPDRAEIISQGQAVDAFFEDFKAPGGALRRSYHTYPSPSEFARLFEKHLRDWLTRRLEAAEAETPPSTSRPPETPAAKRWEGNPYRGLKPFGAEHTPIFFGRGPETDELVKRVRDGVPVLAVIGASGSGKSSLVAAGLLPRLAAGAIPGSAHWVQVRCTPAEQGDDPFRALALALVAHLPPGTQPAADLAERLVREPRYIDDLAGQALAGRPESARLLVFIDQFEELFTARIQETLRAPFVELLDAMAESQRLRTVLTLRADYYEHCTRFESLAGRLRDGSFPLAAPGGRAIGQMIERPAEAAGIDLEPGLAEDILRDFGEEGGSLALLGFTLERLYELRRDGTLSRAAYRDLKGIAGAIEIQGEKAVRDAGGRVDAGGLWGVFDALAEVDEKGGAVRRRAWLDGFSDAEQALVQRLIDARLVTGDRADDGQPWVEVAHEAVLRAWPRFRDWLEQHRDFKLWRKQLGVWMDGGEPLRGLPLAKARAMRDEWQDKLTPGERGYIEDSAARDRRRKRLLRGGAGLAFASLAAAVAIFYPAYLAEQERRSPLYRAADWVRIEPGEFCMGSRGEGEPPGDCRADTPIDPEAQPDEKPPHRVRIEKGFLLARYEVSFEEYDRFAYDTGRRPPSDSGFAAGLAPETAKRLPVINVSWEDARAYAKWLSQKTGRNFRLPTEAEWEYAARAGTRAPYFWEGLPGTACDFANGFDRAHEQELKARFSIDWAPLPCDDPYATLAPVGSFGYNSWHLHDLAGNVWEWVADCYHDSYAGAPPGPAAWTDGMECASGRRVIRGGSWGSDPAFLRSANRNGYTPDNRYYNLGFRLAQDIK